VTASPKSAPRVSIVIPVLNAERDLPACLESIRAQEEPPGGYEIVVSDGGSTDSTRSIARTAGARVVDNPHRKSEPGVAVGMKTAKGQLITVMAADNRMRGRDFIVRMVAQFDDRNVAAAFPRVVSTPEDNLVNRYINRYSDPFNHFVYGSINTSIDLMLRRGLRILAPTVESHPLLSVAQGCTVRAHSVYRGAPDHADDVVAIIELIGAGGKLALVADAEIEHHPTSGLRSLYRKYRLRTKEAFNGQQGYLRRQARMRTSRRIRRWLWIPYSCSLVAPAMHGAVMAIRHRDPILLFHAIVNTVLFGAVATGAAANIISITASPRLPEDKALMGLSRKV
jgi:glycosyltransferase involved in cell wall biosynthesis